MKREKQKWMVEKEKKGREEMSAQLLWLHKEAIQMALGTVGLCSMQLVEEIENGL